MKTTVFAVIGATGLVGLEMLHVLAEYNVPAGNVIPMATASSAGAKVPYGPLSLTVSDVQMADFSRVNIALLAVESEVSRELAPRLAHMGIFVIDNSSQWRMHRNVPLVIPEINPEQMERAKVKRIIANPNCSTIQMLVALAPLHRAFRAFQIFAATYQSVSGAGKAGQKELIAQRDGVKSAVKTFVAPIDLNVVPQVDVLTENGYSKEELKMLNESRKILNAQALKVSATCVRVPVMVGHMVDVKVAFRKPFEMEEVFRLLQNAPGVMLVDDVSQLTPLGLPEGSRDVVVGRVRKDSAFENGLSFVCVANNVRKGAALNAVQIAEAWLAMQQNINAA